MDIVQGRLPVLLQLFVVVALRNLPEYSVVASLYTKALYPIFRMHMPYRLPYTARGNVNVCVSVLKCTTIIPVTYSTHVCFYLLYWCLLLLYSSYILTCHGFSVLCDALDTSFTAGFGSPLLAGRDNGRCGDPTGARSCWP